MRFDVQGGGSARQRFQGGPQPFVPGFGPEGEIDEIPFVLVSGGNDYQVDLLAPGAGVRTVGTALWQTPPITYARLQLIGVRMIAVASAEIGVAETIVADMRLTQLGTQGGIDCLYGAVRAPFRTEGRPFKIPLLGVALSVPFVDHTVRVLRDNPTIDQTQTVRATTVTRQLQDTAQNLNFVMQLSAIVRTIDDRFAEQSR